MVMVLIKSSMIGLFLVACSLQNGLDSFSLSHLGFYFILTDLFLSSRFHFRDTSHINLLKTSFVIIKLF